MRVNIAAAACLLWLSVFLGNAVAAEIRVDPGDGTLAAAVAAAAHGDVLVLQDGTYSGSVIVDKSLTIRALNKAVSAVISGGYMTIEGAGISVTVQGLKFAASIIPREASDVRLLENLLVNVSMALDEYRTSEGDGALLIIGNEITGIGTISTVRSDGAYIAGNILHAGYVATESSAWIVGNAFLDHSGAAAIRADGAGAVARIIGNRVRCTSSGVTACVRSQVGYPLIANNVVEVQSNSTSMPSQNGIYVGVVGEATILNNLVRGIPTDSVRRHGPAVWVNSGGVSRIAGNIVVDWLSAPGSALTTIYASESGRSEIINNLCFNNTDDCPEGNGNLDADPQFLDTLGYELIANSPGLDAGPVDFALADLDRSRNDIGVHGGPWRVAQYDIQRDWDYVGPYAYPLFRGGTWLKNGTLELQAIGVARLR